MTKFARIENGNVVETLQAEELPEFHPSLQWVECPHEASVGWNYSNGTFSKGVDFVEHDSALRSIGATPFQFRKALNASGLRSAVEAYIAGADQDIKDGYEFATEFRSDDPMVLAAAAAVGKTPDEAYEFIAFAKTL